MNKDSNNDNVSVIMSVYNAENKLDETIESVLNQTYKKFEFIIINDCSTDKTLQQLKKFELKDKRIKIINNEINKGLTKSLNIGIRHSRSNNIARIDVGDTWRNDKLEKQIRYLQQTHECVLIGTNVLEINALTNGEKKNYRPETDFEIRESLLSGSPMVHPSILFKKNAVNYYNEKFDVGQDYKLYTELLEQGKAYNIQEFLTVIKTHQTKSISLRKWKKQKKANLKIRFQLYKKHKVSLLRYFTLLPNLILLLIPANAKLWKNKLFSLFRLRKTKNKK